MLQSAKACHTTNALMIKENVLNKAFSLISELLLIYLFYILIYKQ